MITKPPLVCHLLSRCSCFYVIYITLLKAKLDGGWETQDAGGRKCNDLPVTRASESIPWKLEKLGISRSIELVCTIFVSNIVNSDVALKICTMCRQSHKESAQKNLKTSNSCKNFNFQHTNFKKTVHLSSIENFKL